jgi:hypothetical protein
MKKLIIILSFLGLAQAGISQTQQGNNVQLKDLGVQPSNPHAPSKPDPKPADPPKSNILDKATQTYENFGSPKPIIEDKKVVGGSVTIPY